MAYYDSKAELDYVSKGQINWTFIKKKLSTVVPWFMSMIRSYVKENFPHEKWLMDRSELPKYSHKNHF